MMKSSRFNNTYSDTPYMQDPNLGEDKGGLLEPKKDKYKVCSLLAKVHKNFWDSQFCQALRYQNRSRGLVIPKKYIWYLATWLY